VRADGALTRLIGVRIAVTSLALVVPPYIA